MSRFQSYLNSAETILKTYRGVEPFSIYIKSFFAEHKKFGSTDRRVITNLCYAYFRTGKSLANFALQEKILISLFLTSTKSNPVLAAIKPAWDEKVQLTVAEKISSLDISLAATDLFPYEKELTTALDKEEFVWSFLTQPDLFIRLRPGKANKVVSMLSDAGIDFEKETETCLRLASGVKVDEFISLNRDAVIQDYSSQQVGELFDLVGERSHWTIWDACAASGGKSILAKDKLGKIELTVSDLRDSILNQLKKRLLQAEVSVYHSFQSDLTKAIQPMGQSGFDLIIADVPCTGSGTWARTPEQLFYFDEESINKYANTQKAIVSNLISHLKKGGYLLYCTCSVFKKENEEVVEHLQKSAGLELVTAKLFAGASKKADTLFSALLRKPQ